MLKLSAKIEIKGERTWTFEKITSCEIVRDSDALTTTCKLVLPRKIKWRGEASNPIKRGDKISVWLGYDDNLQLAFQGYVLRVGLKAPILLECEDEMWKLKNIPMDYSLLANDISIIKLLENFTNIPVRGVNFVVNSYFRSSAVTVCQWLKFLQSYGPDKFFFRNLEGEYKLVCLNCFTPNISDFVDFYVLNSNVNIVSDSNLIDFKPGSNDVYIRISVLAAVNEKRVFIERGSMEKAVKRFIYRKSLMNEQIANRLADFIVARESNSGLRGSLEIFGGKLIWPFDTVGIIIDGVRKGKYQVAKNIISYGKDGFRQNITLGVLAH